VGQVEEDAAQGQVSRQDRRQEHALAASHVDEYTGPEKS
jgi:hypothetical protein